MNLPDRTPDRASRKLPWRPTSFEGKVRIWRMWSVVGGFNLGGWSVGVGFDDGPLGFWLNIGPLFVGVEQDESAIESYADLRDWSRTLYRLAIPKRKLELRLEFDLNIWNVGYMMGDLHDHGIYLGPVNLQIEYDKFYDWIDNHTPPARLQCRCD